MAAVVYKLSDVLLYLSKTTGEISAVIVKNGGSEIEFRGSIETVRKQLDEAEEWTAQEGIRGVTVRQV